VRLPEKLRDKLKIPLGTLLLEKDTNKENVLKKISNVSYIITVGDATTEKMLSFGIVPSLQIVDALEKRAKREPPTSAQIITNISCDNPAGEITENSIDQIKKAFKSKPPVQIMINGEEDLLVIPVCIFAPENSVVMYGQPNEGLVIVHINEEIRHKAQTILNSMN
jgi:uncharacterized protein (UPF0218 family)